MNWLFIISIDIIGLCLVVFGFYIGHYSDSAMFGTILMFEMAYALNEYNIDKKRKTNGQA